MGQKDFICVKHNHVHMLMPEPMTMLLYLAENSFANEVKLRIWKEDCPCGLNGIKTSLEVKEGGRGSTSEKEVRRWSRGGSSVFTL
jgi:hypothetical protein